MILGPRSSPARSRPLRTSEETRGPSAGASTPAWQNVHANIWQVGPRSYAAYLDVESPRDRSAGLPSTVES